MAKATMLVAPELLLHSMFKGAQLDARIVGASYDPVDRYIRLDLEGPDVPEAETVHAVVHKTEYKVDLQPWPPKVSP